MKSRGRYAASWNRIRGCWHGTVELPRRALRAVIYVLQTTPRHVLAVVAAGVLGFGLTVLLPAVWAYWLMVDPVPNGTPGRVTGTVLRAVIERVVPPPQHATAVVRQRSNSMPSVRPAKPVGPAANGQ